MASPTKSHSGDPPPVNTGMEDNQDDIVMLETERQDRAAKTPEPQLDQQHISSDTPDTPGALGPFDWEDFEARYEKALLDADEHEREVLNEAENLSKVTISSLIKQGGCSLY